MDEDKPHLRARITKAIDDLVKRINPPPREEVRRWLVDDAPPITAEKKAIPLSELFKGFAGFWLRVRRRALRVFAGALVLVDVCLGVLLFSNVWYLNLLLYAYLIPSFIILVHYLRLTRK